MVEHFLDTSFFWKLNQNFSNVLMSKMLTILFTFYVSVEKKSIFNIYIFWDVFGINYSQTLSFMS